MVEVRVGDIHASLAWDVWEEWVRQGRVPADAQVRFAAVTGSEWVRADAMESYAVLVEEGLSAKALSRMSTVAPIVTALLVGIQIRIWWATHSSAVADWVSRDGVNFSPPILEDGQSWRWLTSGFLHLDFGHIAMNMLWLGYTGIALERTLGRLNLLTLYIGSVMGGSLMSMLFKPETSSLGASGGVFGLVAAVTIIGFTQPDVLPKGTRRSFGFAMLPYLVVMFASGLSNPMTDNWAHFGGLITGVVLGGLVSPPARPRERRRNRLVAGTVAVVTVVLLAIPPLFGPTIAPLADSETVRMNAPGMSPVPAEGYSEVRWNAPVGWRVGTLTSGLTGMRSPSPAASDRGFAVQLGESNAPMTPEQLLATFRARLERTGTVPTSDEPVTTTLAGYPALATWVSMGGRRMYWVGATRGQQHLTAVWEVDEADEQRLDPMRTRLFQGVEWDLPYALIDAQSRVDNAPNSVTATRDLALAEAMVGNPEAAIARLLELLEARPTDVDTYQALFQVGQTYPDAVADRDALFDRALRDIPTASMIATIAESLVEEGRDNVAVGLLELGWLSTPRSRPLRRGLRRLGRPTDVDTQTGRALWRLADPQGVVDDSVELPAAPDPLTIAAGQLEGARIAALQDARCTALATELPFMSDEAAAQRLLRLQLGYLPQSISTTQWDRVHRGLLETAEGRVPRWMCEPLRTAVSGDTVTTWIAEAAVETEGEPTP